MGRRVGRTELAAFVAERMQKLAGNETRLRREAFAVISASLRMH
jgi:hypothetical protein